MDTFKHVHPREKYLKSVRPFYDSDIIKVITGIRRSGKSFILKAIINELLGSGVEGSRIVYIPLDKRGFKGIKTPDALEHTNLSATASSSLPSLPATGT